mmetsp:Transcript_70124/g.116932  ORF Transcript_70124/g.116932 Transcript_70124/m.116932 type:complete len:256 (-) Transcript_70124:275-1042(-)
MHTLPSLARHDVHGLLLLGEHEVHHGLSIVTLAGAVGVRLAVDNHGRAGVVPIDVAGVGLEHRFLDDIIHQIGCLVHLHVARLPLVRWGEDCHVRGQARRHGHGLDFRVLQLGRLLLRGPRGVVQALQPVVGLADAVRLVGGPGQSRPPVLLNAAHLLPRRDLPDLQIGLVILLVAAERHDVGVLGRDREVQDLPLRDAELDLPSEGVAYVDAIGLVVRGHQHRTIGGHADVHFIARGEVVALHRPPFRTTKALH